MPSELLRLGVIQIPDASGKNYTPYNLNPYPVTDSRGNAQVIRVPAGAGEEVMRPVMRPQPRQARAREHPAHRPLPGLGQETAGQHAEGAERRGLVVGGV